MPYIDARQSYTITILHIHKKGSFYKVPIPKKQRKVEDGIWQLVDNRWLVDVQPQGRHSERVRKIHKTKVDAKQHKNEIIKKSLNGEKLKQTRDVRRLSDICQAWHTYHGHSIKSGDKRLQQLLATANALGNPRAEYIDPKAFIEYRTARLEEGITPNHLNHELTYLKSAFNELARVDDWKLPNPFAKIKKLPLPERSHRFLTHLEIDQLIESASSEDARNPDLLTIIRICLSIGCRFGEANDLKAEQVHSGKIHLEKTKNGRKRSIPITEEMAREILAGRPNSGRLFGNAWKAFSHAIERANISLPKGTDTHVLRHTYASHFMMNGGNILHLSKILGHQTIQQTMTYAHLAPDHLETAITYSPLQNIASKKTG